MSGVIELSHDLVAQRDNRSLWLHCRQPLPDHRRRLLLHRTASSVLLAPDTLCIINCQQLVGRQLLELLFDLRKLRSILGRKSMVPVRLAILLNLLLLFPVMLIKFAWMKPVLEIIMIPRLVFWIIFLVTFC